MKKYICSEWSKHKRTFIRKLTVLAPVITMLMNIFSPAWYQQNSFNWWYVLLFPGVITLLCTMVEQQDGGRMQYRGIMPLPISLKNIWIAKVYVIILLSISVNLLFLILNILGGTAIYFIYKIPISISVFHAFAGILCIVIASMWEIPFCLWLSKKTGTFTTVVINAGIGSILGVAFADTKFWILCPYSWVSRLMVPAIGILPNGMPVLESTDELSIPVMMIIVTLLLSLILCLFLTKYSAKYFSTQEVI